jgi:hypothetical protein
MNQFTKKIVGACVALLTLATGCATFRETPDAHASRTARVLAYGHLRQCLSESRGWYDDECYRLAREECRETKQDSDCASTLLFWERMGAWERDARGANVR